jgi:hypothetical protein
MSKNTKMSQPISIFSDSAKSSQIMSDLAAAIDRLSHDHIVVQGTAKPGKLRSFGTKAIRYRMGRAL